MKLDLIEANWHGYAHTHTHTPFRPSCRILNGFVSPATTDSLVKPQTTVISVS